MDPDNIPFNALIVGPLTQAKRSFSLTSSTALFCGRFDYVVLICPTFAYNKTLYRLAERDPRLFFIIREQHEWSFG